jgi:hypothetical protein
MLSDGLYLAAQLARVALLCGAAYIFTYVMLAI